MITSTHNIDELGTRTVTVYLPERSDVQDLKVGDHAPDCFGRMQAVSEISYRGTDIEGRAFVGYFTRSETGFTCSNSMKVGELMRHVGMSVKWRSAEVDAMEALLRREHGL